MAKVIITGKAGKAFIEQHKKAVSQARERIKKRMPPKEIRQIIEQKTKETSDINNGNIDTQSFRLGMYAMWYHLNQQHQI